MFKCIYKEDYHNKFNSCVIEEQNCLVSLLSGEKNNMCDMSSLDRRAKMCDMSPLWTEEKKCVTCPLWTEEQICVTCPLWTEEKHV